MGTIDNRRTGPDGASAELRMESRTSTLPTGVVTEHSHLSHPGASAIVAFADPDTVLMIRQYRPPVGQFVWEVPAGKINGGETPMECAGRELREEVGRAAGRLHLLGRLWMEPGYTDEVMHIYRADDLKVVPAAREHDEVIEQHEMSLQDAFDLIRGQRFWDAKSLIALELAAESSGRFLR